LKFIPVNEPLLQGNEKKYLIECIDTGWISSEGPFVTKLEKNFAEVCGRKHGIAVCNGTAALETAVSSLGIKQGDEVIMPSFTIISCALAVIRAGAIPVFADCDPVTWNIDPVSIRKKITSRTKAIMPVHIYGLPADMNEILKIAEEYGLMIIEDAAEQIGQKYFGKPCGSFGDISTFSFYPNKHITTGEGGMVVTDDDELADRCRSIRNLCFKPEKRFVHDELGYNFRMTNLQAAVGVAQLEKLDEFIIKKRHIGNLYNEYLEGEGKITIPLSSTSYADNIYWVYGVVLKKESGITAETAMKNLSEAGIGTRPFFYPMHKQPVLLNNGTVKDESLPVSEMLSEMGFYLPSGLALSDEDVQRSANALRKILGQ
jgi:perosamine synthetase